MPVDEPTCLACSATRPTRVAKVSNTPVYACQECGLTFCWPLPTVGSPSSGAHSIVTEETFTHGILSMTPERQRVLDSVAERRHQHYAKALGRSSYSLLEIGCGGAGLAAPFARLGVDYHGIDIDERPVAAAIERGVENLTVGDFMDLPITREFDVIFMTQVLEHITRPTAMAERCRSALVDGGLIHVDVPNQATLAGLPSRAARGIGPRFGAIDSPHHSIAYNVRALNGVFAPLFDVSAFTASPDDPVWGQATTPGRLARTYYAAQRAVRAQSLVVVFGPARPAV